MAEDIFSEARAEYRAQQTQAILRRYAPAAGGVILACLLAVGVWQWRAYHDRTARLAFSARYFEAVNALDATSGAPPADAVRKASEASFADLAQHAPAEIRDFAALRLGSLRAQRHDVPGAVAAWRTVSEDGKASPELKALAQYLSLNATIDTARADDLRKGYAALEAHGGPWRALAQEGIAMLDLQPGASAAQNKEAQQLLTRLVQAPDAPDGVRQRASALLQTFPPEPSTERTAGSGPDHTHAEPTIETPGKAG